MRVPMRIVVLLCCLNLAGRHNRCRLEGAMRFSYHFSRARTVGYEVPACITPVISMTDFWGPLVPKSGHKPCGLCLFAIAP